MSKAVLVTGSSSGIGKAIATRLHAEGWSVALNGYRTEDAGRQLAAELAGSVYLDADVSSPAEAQRLVDEAAAAFGRLDAVVNNAGIARQIPHHDLDAVPDDFWDRVMGINLKGPWNVAKAARKHLVQTRGQIINNASLAGITAAGSSIPYAVSKAGVLHLTRLLAKALGPEIRVNAVAPGYINTDMISHLRPEVHAERVSSIPLGRPGEADEVAKLIRFLCSDDASYITGQLIGADGGLVL
jgi:ketoreductase RED2